MAQPGGWARGAAGTSEGDSPGIFEVPWEMGQAVFGDGRGLVATSCPTVVSEQVRGQGGDQAVG